MPPFEISGNPSDGYTINWLENTEPLPSTPTMTWADVARGEASVNSDNPYFPYHSPSDLFKFDFDYDCSDIYKRDFGYGDNIKVLPIGIKVLFDSNGNKKIGIIKSYGINKRNYYLIIDGRIKLATLGKDMFLLSSKEEIE
jgi:hypothetical protein